MTFSFALALLLAAPPLSFAERVEGARAVEKARYTFVIGATKPFDEVYPRSVFEKKVKRELAEERVLSSRFGMHVTPDLLSAEYDRIEKETRAPDQWEAIRKALGGSRKKIEEIVCRPLLVDRVLRARFAFDQKIHEAEHQKARAAREAFLAGKTPKGSNTIRLSRKAEPGGTDELLAKARSEASGPKILTPDATGKEQRCFRARRSRDGESPREGAEEEGRRHDDPGRAKPLLGVPSRDVGSRRMARGSRSGSEARLRSLARRGAEGQAALGSGAGGPLYRIARGPSRTRAGR